MQLSDLSLHVLFTMNLLFLLALVTIHIARKSFAHDLKLQQSMILMVGIIIVFKIFYVLAFYALFYPEWGMINDALFYYNQIRLVTDNPIESIIVFANGHSRGLPAIYGLIFYVHQVYSIYAVLALNIFIAVLTCLVAFLLTQTMTNDKLLPLVAMGLVAIYPECLFWNARLYKENLVILLMPLMSYFAIRLFSTRNWKFFFCLILVAFALFTVRIYFILELILIAIYYGIIYAKKKPIWMIIALSSIVFLLYFLYQDNNIVIRILTWKNPELRSIDGISGEFLWSLFAKNARQVFSVIAGGKFGSFGIALMPFALLVGMLLITTIVKLKTIFKNYYISAGLNLFIVLCFYFSLIFAEYAGIRFRSCVSVLLICVATVAGSYWRKRLALPRFVLYPHTRISGSNDRSII